MELTLKELNKELKYLKREKQYIVRFWELNAQGLKDFADNKEQNDEERLKEWRHVNRVIERNNWSVMRILYMKSLDDEIKVIEDKIKELKNN